MLKASAQRSAMQLPMPSSRLAEPAADTRYKRAHAGAAGGVDIHGIAVSPGETAAFGRVGARPVLLIPGRFDAALAVWLVIGWPLLARLSGLREEQPTSAATLTRKVASSLGMTEVIPVRVHDGAADPLASGYWPLAAVAAADGWILVPPTVEGYPAFGKVVVRAWP